MTIVKDVDIRSERCNLQHENQQLFNYKLSHYERQLLEEKITGLKKIAFKDLSSTAFISDVIFFLKIWLRKMIYHHLMKPEVVLKDCGLGCIKPTC